MVLAVCSVPATASTAYYCSSGCTNLDTAFGGGLSSAGLTFSSPLITFTGDTSGTTVTDIGGSLVNFAGLNGANPDTLNVVSSTLQQSVGGTGVSITINLPAAIYALGFHVTNTGGTLSTNIGPDSTSLFLNGQSEFYGVISTTPITSFAIGQSGGGKLVLTDFGIGTQSPTNGGGGDTPEPSTLMLLGLGLIGLPILKRRM